MNIVLYQPDIPQNAGAFVRLCACLGMNLHIIEPCGFVWDEKKLKSVAMDYRDRITITRHTGFDRFMDAKSTSRLILLTTKAASRYTDIDYRGDDFLMFGRESSGVPEPVHAVASVRVTIPMQPGARSLNVVNAASMVAGEAKRQTGWA